MLSEVMNMSQTRTTIYLDSRVHKALKIRAAQTSRSISDVVSEALLLSLKEDTIDLQKIRERVGEPTVSYDAVLKELKKDGLL